MQTVAESADKDSDDDRTAGQTEFQRCRHAGHGKRYGSDDKAGQKADEYRRQMRFVELAHGIAQHCGRLVDSRGLAHDDHAVAQLQDQIGRCEKYHAAAHDTADVDAVAVAQMKRAEAAAVDRGARHDDAARDD